jgi:hypothetical protein
MAPKRKKQKLSRSSSSLKQIALEAIQEFFDEFLGVTGQELAWIIVLVCASCLTHDAIHPRPLCPPITPADPLRMTFWVLAVASTSGNQNHQS